MKTITRRELQTMIKEEIENTLEENIETIKLKNGNGKIKIFPKQGIEIFDRLGFLVGALTVDDIKDINEKLSNL